MLQILLFGYWAAMKVYAKLARLQIPSETTSIKARFLIQSCDQKQYVLLPQCSTRVHFFSLFSNCINHVADYQVTAVTSQGKSLPESFLCQELIQLSKQEEGNDMKRTVVCSIKHLPNTEVKEIHQSEAGRMSN